MSKEKFRFSKLFSHGGHRAHRGINTTNQTKITMLKAHLSFVSRRSFPFAFSPELSMAFVAKVFELFCLYNLVPFLLNHYIFSLGTAGDDLPGQLQVAFRAARASII